MMSTSAAVNASITDMAGSFLFSLVRHLFLAASLYPRSLPEEGIRSPFAAHLITACSETACGRVSISSNSSRYHPLQASVEFSIITLLKLMVESGLFFYGTVSYGSVRQCNGSREKLNGHSVME